MKTQPRYSPAELTRQHIEGGRSSFQQTLQKDADFYKKKYEALVKKVDLVPEITIERGKTVMPPLAELLTLYEISQPEIILTESDRRRKPIVCTSWFIAGSADFGCYKGGNSVDGDIEVVVDQDDRLRPYRGDPKFTFRLKDPAFLTDDEKKEYHALCTCIYQGDKLISKADTPSSLLWMLRNKVDAFGLIAAGMAEPITQQV